jgi:hypothetical protein
VRIKKIGWLPIAHRVTCVSIPVANAQVRTSHDAIGTSSQAKPGAVPARIARQMCAARVNLSLLPVLGIVRGLLKVATLSLIVAVAPVAALADDLSERGGCR